MRFGFYLPTRGPLAEPDAITAIVRGGESMGYATIVIGDHIVFPVGVASKYPYTVEGAFPGRGDALEQLALISFVAGITERVRLVTSVMILPHRNPLLTAKMLATIDVLSKGRLTVGVGVGWMREEFDALDAADFEKRGRASDEYIEILEKCWTQDPVSHSGEFYAFETLHCLPHPVQEPHPPIWVGGHSPASLRRVARFGDGWQPVGGTTASPLPPAEFQTLLDRLKRLTEAEGRDYASLTIAYKAPSYDPGRVPQGHDRLLFTGEPGRIAEDILAYQAMGVAEVSFDFRSPPVSKALDRMHQFMEEVAPIVG